MISGRLVVEDGATPYAPATVRDASAQARTVEGTVEDGIAAGQTEQ